MGFAHGDSHMKAHQFLFVYGSLLKDCGHDIHRILRDDFVFVGKATYQGVLYNLGMYPAAVASGNPGDRVHGEVYRLPEPEPVLRYLDAYEGCNRAAPYYVRQKALVRLEDGKDIQAWIYLYNRDITGYEIIATGDYLQHLAELTYEI